MVWWLKGHILSFDGAQVGHRRRGRENSHSTYKKIAKDKITSYMIKSVSIVVTTGTCVFQLVPERVDSRMPTVTHSRHLTPSRLTLWHFRSLSFYICLFEKLSRCFEGEVEWDFSLITYVLRCQYLEFVPGFTWVPVSPRSPKNGACSGGLQAVNAIRQSSC